MDNPPSLKPLYWVGSSKRDLRSLPSPVEDLFGYALYLAQDGKKHEQAKPLKGFGSAGCNGPRSFPSEELESRPGNRTVFPSLFSLGNGPRRQGFARVAHP
jgi:phage-related protein